MLYSEIVRLWKEKGIDSVNALDQALSNFRIVFAYNSGVIENPEISYHNTREIFENGRVVGFTGNVRTIYEIQNQKACYDFLTRQIVNKRPIDAQLIKKIHKELTRGTYDERRWEKGERPGQYKLHDYVVANAQGAFPEDVPNEIDELCEEIQKVADKGDNIIEAAAYVHCKFENIHPFADGNGRVGRSLMNYFLMTHNHPPLVIYNETKDKYYKALEHYDETGDIGEFVNYMKQSIEKTWDRKPDINKVKLADLHLEQ